MYPVNLLPMWPVRTDPVTGRGKISLDAKALAKLIRSQENYKEGQNVILNVCSTGGDGDKSIAKELARELKVKVWAPTQKTIRRTLQTRFGDLHVSDSVLHHGKYEEFGP